MSLKTRFLFSVLAHQINEMSQRQLVSEVSCEIFKVFQESSSSILESLISRILLMILKKNF